MNPLLTASESRRAQALAVFQARGGGWKADQNSFQG
jgi:hypothetical protein